mmetsp:Transcript_44326/g.126929  ORF Transcript_44326/g.126929 Transcript_44326/m.126929 type:complete len:81 (-) Transcript_44326:433-675(-)
MCRLVPVLLELAAIIVEQCCQEDPVTATSPMLLLLMFKARPRLRNWRRQCSASGYALPTLNCVQLFGQQLQKVLGARKAM